MRGSVGPKRRDSGKGIGRPPAHGLWALKASVRRLGSRVIDRRTTLGKQLARWRADLIDDLGGAAEISTQQAQLVDLAVRTKLMVDSIDSWILAQKTLVLYRKRALIPAVKERTQLADALARYLQALGLSRRVREAPDIGHYLADRYGANGNDQD